MKLKILLNCLLIFIVGIQNISEYPGNQKDTKFYMLGQDPPGLSPELYAPGYVAKGFHEHAIAFSPKGDELFYVMSDINYQKYSIVQIKKSRSKWLPQEIAPFSGDYKDYGGCYGQDGDSFIFASNRPQKGKLEASLDLWITHKTNGKWSEPINVGAPINSTFKEVNPSLDAENNLYFQSNRDGDWNIYFSAFIDGSYTEAILLDSINSGFNDSAPWISADGSFILFQSNREDNRQMDIYVSFKEKEQWTTAINLGDKINTKFSEFAPRLSPDGKYLFFTSYRSFEWDDFKDKTFEEMIKLYQSPANGYATIYWVDAKTIELLRPDNQ